MIRTAPFAFVVALALALPVAAQTLPPEPEDEHEHDQAPKPGKFPSLTITASIDAMTDKETGDVVRTIRASGSTAYPAGTSLVVEARLKGADGFLDKKHQTYVDGDGHWEGALDDMGRNVFKGLYEVRVTFDRQFQQNAINNAIELKGWSLNIHSQSTQIQFGTPEEEAREKIDVDQVYARAFASLKKGVDETIKQYEANLAEYSKLKWGDFVDDVSAELIRADRELGTYRRSHDNLRDFRTYEQISKLFVITTSRLYTSLTTAIETDKGPKSAQERENAKRMLDGLRDSVAELEQTVGQVKIDPNWKPVDAKPVRYTRTDPPVKPFDMVTPLPKGPEEGKGRMGTNLVPKSRFGVAELGIGLAVLCGLAMLAILLKKK